MGGGRGRPANERPSPLASFSLLKYALISCFAPPPFLPPLKEHIWTHRVCISRKRAFLHNLKILIYTLKLSTKNGLQIPQKPAVPPKLNSRYHLPCGYPYGILSKGVLIKSTHTNLLHHPCFTKMD